MKQDFLNPKVDQEVKHLVDRVLGILFLIGIVIVVIAPFVASRLVTWALG